MPEMCYDALLVLRQMSLYARNPIQYCESSGEVLQQTSPVKLANDNYCISMIRGLRYMLWPPMPLQINSGLTLSEICSNGSTTVRMFEDPATCSRVNFVKRWINSGASIEILAIRSGPCLYSERNAVEAKLGGICDHVVEWWWLSGKLYICSTGVRDFFVPLTYVA